MSSPCATAATALPGTPPLETLLQAQARRLRSHAAACCAWLLLFTGAWFAALAAAGVRLSPALCVLGALVPLLGFALLASPVRPASPYTLRIVAATLFLPVGLLFAAASLDFELTRPAPARLDVQRLFAGAAIVEDADLVAAGVVLTRRGSFADGSELRLMRFADADAAHHYLATLSQALYGEAFSEQGRQGVRLSRGVMPGALMLLERHGADLLELRARDLTGGLARLTRQQVPPPMPDTPADTTPHWPFFVAAGFAHALAFVALVFWGGRRTTRVAAAAGVAPINAAALRARLESFATSTHAPFVLTEASDTRFVIALPVAPLRSHRITLVLRPERREVSVSERVGVHGARPRDADEADLGSLGDTTFDPTRPHADRVWQTSWQATLIDPVRLAAVPLRPLGLHAELPPAYAVALDGDGVLTALCALVTRSGWDWQPRLGSA